MLLLKRVFTFQLSLKTKLPFLLKNISLGKISCKVSWCLVAHFSHLCFGLLSSPKAFWGTKSAGNTLHIDYYMAYMDLIFWVPLGKNCTSEAADREFVARFFCGWRLLAQVAAGCGNAALVAWAAAALLVWSSMETQQRHSFGLLARNRKRRSFKWMLLLKILDLQRKSSPWNIIIFFHGVNEGRITVATLFCSYCCLIPYHQQQQTLVKRLFPVLTSI